MAAPATTEVVNRPGSGVPEEVGDAERARLRLRERVLGVPLPGDRNLGWLALLAVTALGTWLRFNRLSVPSDRIFDEVYYACDARNLLRFGVEHATVSNSNCALASGPGYVVHPPLGKWLIAAGEQIFGYNSLGWRFSAAVVGSLAILVVGRTARRLTRSTLLGCFAALLMSLDALEFVQSRASMLDIFLMFWIAAAFACIVADRDWSRARLADVTAPVESSGPRVGVRWWRVGAGFCLGCACATKWDGVFYVAALLLLTSFWDAGARRTIGVRRPIRAMLRRDLPASVSSYVGLAFAVYVVSWTGWFLGDANTAWDHDRYVHGQGTFGHAVAVAHGWLSYHTEILAFHDSLHASHPYQSHPIGWLLLARPVSYFYTSPKTGQAGCHAIHQDCSREVLAIGTPAIWWASIAALVVMVWLWAARRDWRAGAVLLAVAATIVPWMWYDLGRRTEFLFYALPALPFMVIALAMCAGLALGPPRNPNHRAVGAVLVGAYALIVLANFAYLYPIIAAKVIPYSSWQARMWFNSWI